MKSEKQRLHLERVSKIPRTPEWKNKIRLSKLGERNPRWSGEKVTYRGLHLWVQRQLGKAKRCVECGVNEMPSGRKQYFEWSNISLEYKRDLNDWKELCQKCHRKYDKTIKEKKISLYD